MILSHHGQLEFGSPKLPQFPEALLLHYLDDMDSKMECMRALIENDRQVEGCFTTYQSGPGARGAEEGSLPEWMGSRARATPRRSMESAEPESVPEAAPAVPAPVAAPAAVTPAVCAQAGFGVRRQIKQALQPAGPKQES